jgi:microcystin-dependent protein
MRKFLTPYSPAAWFVAGASIVGGIAFAASPATFSAGETLQASKLNANFTALEQRIAALEAVGGGAPVGTVVAFAGPTGNLSGEWLPCDGRSVSRSTYAALFSLVGTSHGRGDGSTTFALPDLRGRFVRGVDSGAGRDPDRSNRVASTGEVVGDVVGSVQSDAFRAHNHTGLTDGESQWFADGVGYGSPGSNATITAGQGSWLGLSFSSGSAPRRHKHPIPSEGGQENRPANVALNFIIRVR